MILIITIIKVSSVANNSNSNSVRVLMLLGKAETTTPLWVPSFPYSCFSSFFYVTLHFPRIHIWLKICAILSLSTSLKLTWIALIWRHNPETATAYHPRFHSELQVTVEHFRTGKGLSTPLPLLPPLHILFGWVKVEFLSWATYPIKLLLTQFLILFFFLLCSFQLFFLMSLFLRHFLKIIF